MRHRLTRLADSDIVSILRDTRKNFGRDQVLIYAAIIEGAIAMAAENPALASAIDRPEIGEGVRSLHLELVKRRRRSASHILYFKQWIAGDGEGELIVLRVLHEGMEPRRRLIQALREPGE